MSALQQSIKQTSLGCVSLAATVKITPLLPQFWPALAVGSLHVPPRKDDRLEATDVEKAALAVLARRASATRAFAKQSSRRRQAPTFSPSI